MEGITLEKLQVIIDAYTKPYRDEVEKVKQKTDTVTRHVEKQTGKIRNAFSKVGRAVGASLGVAAIGAFAKSCIDLGSDLAEVQNVVDVTFGAMSKSVDAFAKNAIAQFGLSETMAKRYMGTYGAMAKAFGFTTEEAYKMSASITGLTGDVASFYNITQDAAYTKLKSIFSGETESLKDLGIVMTQTALDQYALNNGLGKTTAKMTEQEKVMLRYQFVMSQLSAAQGDFTRTSGGWANQIRVLQLRFESLRATIGQGLINALTPVIKSLNTLLEKLQTVAEVFRQLTVAVFGEAGGSTGGGIEDAAGSAGDISESLGDAVTSAKELNKQLAKFDELNVLSTKDSKGGGDNDFSGMFPDVDTSIGGDAGEKAAGIIDKITAALERLKQIAKPTTDAIMKLWNEGLKKLGEFTWGTIKDFWENFLKPMGVWMLSDSAGLPRFFNITNDLLNEIDWPRLKASLAEFYEALQKPAKFVWTGLMDFYEYFLKPVAVWTMGVGLPQLIDALTVFVNTIHWDEINAALKNLWDALAPFAIAVGQGLVNFFKDLLAVGADFINKVVPGGIQGLADALNSIDPDTAERIGYALGAVITALLGFRLLGGIVSIIEKAIKAISGSKTVKGITVVKDAIKGIVGLKIWGDIAAFFSLLAEGEPLVGTLAAAFPKLATAFGSIGGVVSGAASTIGGAISGIVTALAAALGVSVGAAAAIVAAIVAAVAAIVYALTHWDKVKAFFTETIPNWWNNTVVPFWNNITKWFSDLWENVKSTAIEKWNSLITWFGELPEKIAYQIGFTAGKIYTWARDIWNTVKETVPKIIEDTVTWFKALPQNIYDAILGFIDMAAEWCNDAYNTFIQWVSKTVSDVVDWFKSLPGKIWNEIILIKDNFLEWVSDMITAVKSEVPKIIESIVNFFKELPKKLLEAGKNAVTGFVDGLKSKWESLKGWVEKIGDSVSQGFNDALGIHSPSTVLKKVGEYVMAGFQLGMKGKENGLLSYVKDFAQKIVDVLKGALDIHSPSRITAKIGEFFVDGFNFKVRDKIPESVDYTQKWADKISSVKVKPASIEAKTKTTVDTDYNDHSDEETKKLLREQNDLLRAILSRTGITTRQVFDAWKQEAVEYKKRTGKNPVMA